MACTEIPPIKSISDLLVFPTECQYYFWLIILGVIFLIVAWTIFKNEEKRKGEGDMISALATSSLAVTFLGILGTLVKNSDNIPMIQSDGIMSPLLIMIAITIVLVLIWIFKD